MDTFLKANIHPAVWDPWSMEMSCQKFKRAVTSMEKVLESLYLLYLSTFVRFLS
jgi:hypothetical protein